jgi:hypothetical protein
LCLTDSFVIDAHDVVNALTRGQVEQAGVSFIVDWSEPSGTGSVHDEENQFDLNYTFTNSRIEWSATKQGFSFVSDPATTSVSDFAELGSERNGVFF